jgi:hypothetical protein
MKDKSEVTMTAHLYLENEGFMAFESNQIFFKFVVPKKLTAINEIKTYDNGYLVLDTNYGEEYIDLKAVADEIDLRLNFEVYNPVLRRI